MDFYFIKQHEQSHNHHDNCRKILEHSSKSKEFINLKLKVVLKFHESSSKEIWVNVWH